MQFFSQKIDEPPTPYSYFEDSATEVAGSPQDGNHRGDLMSEWSTLQAKLNYESYRQDHEPEGHHHVHIRDSDASLGEPEIVFDSPEKQKAHEEFVHKRSAHYNEFKVLKAFHDAALEVEEFEENEDEERELEALKNEMNVDVDEENSRGNVDVVETLNSEYSSNPIHHAQAGVVEQQLDTFELQKGYQEQMREMDEDLEDEEEFMNKDNYTISMK